MGLSFKIAGRIAKPVSEVFEAVANPDRLSAYFTTGGAEGRLETGVTVYWDFADFPGRFPVKVTRVVKDKEIVLQWAAHESGEVSSSGVMPEAANYDTMVTMAFEPLDDGRTLVTISEEGWRDTPGGLKASYGNCEGWTQMLCALKGWVEHGVNLREGFYK
ncbi:SRPBCC family protein [Roseibium salinum]|uniref:SRPBCC family protein n=1 Tax=Roseibium salinum TaxID=1604349 RepID=A0ABT3QYN8_9HYPH|nr:SRPBCC family protein [Roseibium sp. DSM 29163]MCX2721955.1 SRPBCC family protein [Roseibium sp. DSM 29163]